MGYAPTERLDITWAARNTAWRHYHLPVRRRTTDTPAKHWDLTLDDLPDSAPGDVVREWCGRWGEYPQSGIAVEDRGRGLLLHGQPGRGKTHMACVAANHVSDLGWSTKFVSVANLYAMSLDALRARDEERREELDTALAAYEDWRGWRVVVLDDLGKEHKTASRWAEDNVDRVVRNRYSDAAPTIVTTNMTPEEIADTYGASMGSYIYEAFTIVKVAGPDRRRQG